tara:strand:+ start:474 stop:2417 length:1944 start_codon:yes stop_codon:yes gene_type:complete
MSAFAFFGGMADTYTDIEASKVKAAAKQAKDQAKAVESNFSLTNPDGTPVFKNGFRSTVGSGGIDQVVSSEVAFSEELNSILIDYDTEANTKDTEGLLYKDYSNERLQELANIVNNKQSTEEEIEQANSVLRSASRAKYSFNIYNSLTTDPHYIDQVRAQTSNAQQFYMKSESISDAERARPDYRLVLPYLKHYPTIRKRFEDVTNTNKKPLTTPSEVWSFYMKDIKGDNWETVIENADGLTEKEEQLKTFNDLYGKWKNTEFGTGPEKTAAASYFLQNNLETDVNSIVKMVSGYYPEMTVGSKFAGTISSEKLDQTDKTFEKKLYLTIDTTKTIARLTQDMRSMLLELGVLKDDKGQSIGTFSGTAALNFVKMYDNIFAQGGAADYAPKMFKGFVAQLNNNKFGNKNISEYGNFIQLEGENLTLQEFLDREFKYTNDDGSKGTITGKQALENSSTAEKADYWQDTIGLAGLYLSSEISLAFTLAIARQDFEGGKAVSDPDFERSLQEARAGGDSFGFGNASAKFKKFDSLIVEFSRRALPSAIYSKAKNLNKIHAVQSVSNHLSSLINLADTGTFDDDVPNSFTGRFLPAGIVLDDEILYEKVKNNKYYNYGTIGNTRQNKIIPFLDDNVSEDERIDAAMEKLKNS